MSINGFQALCIVLYTCTDTLIHHQVDFWWKINICWFLFELGIGSCFINILSFFPLWTLQMVLKGNALLLPLHWHCGSQSLKILRKNFSLSQTGKTNNQGSYVVSSSSWLVYFKLNHELWIHRNLERGRNNDIILIYYYLNWLHVKLLSVRCPILRMCGHWTWRVWAGCRQCSGGLLLVAGLIIPLG